MSTLTGFLAGKKTYIVAAAILIHALSGLYLGQPVNWLEVLNGIGLATLRNAIPKA